METMEMEQPLQRKEVIMETMEMEQTEVNPYSKWLKLQIWFIHTRFCSFFLKFMSWILYYICFCKAAVFVSGLVFSHKLVDYVVLRILITYFSDKSAEVEFSLQKSAILTTIQEVLSVTLVIVATWNSYNSPTRPLKIILFSTISYTIGLFVLYFVTPPVSQGIFITGIISAIILLAVGKAGVKPLIGAFLTEQIKHHNEHNENFNKRNEKQKEDQIEAQKIVWSFLAWGCGVVTAYRMYHLQWKPTFMWTAIAMAISLFLFSLGYLSYLCKWDSLSYHCKELTFPGKPFIIFRVVRASLQRRNLNYPCSTDQYHRNNSEDEEEKSYILPNTEGKFYVSPKIKFLRWLDKAAVIESSITLHPQQQKNSGRLCTVSEVRESKLLLKLFPMWGCFLVFGLVRSAGNTFFPEQGNQLQSEQFMVFVLTFKPILRGTISYLLNLSIRKWVPENKQRQAQIVRIWMGMVISIFCCIVPWRVEVRRLKIVANQGLQDVTDKVIPMSIFWLVPQFCLLGLMEGFAVNGLDEYISYHFPKWMNDHVSAINEFVIGIGSCFHIFFVLANKSLFGDKVNNSHLDTYYKRLMIVSIVNMCYNSCLSILYAK